MKRPIIRITPELCVGCGFCVIGCYQGALKLVNNRITIVDERLCGGMGACIRYCQGQGLSIEVREAEPYDETAVLDGLIPLGPKALRDHFTQLIEFFAQEQAEQGLACLRERGISLQTERGEELPEKLARMIAAQKNEESAPEPPARTLGEDAVPFQSSELKHFPIKLNFVNPEAGYMRQAHVLVAADCTAFAFGTFHSYLLRGKSLVVLCPRLEEESRKLHVRKISELFDHALIASLTVAVMDLPCCDATVQLVREAREKSRRYIPFKVVTLSLGGNVKSEKWV